MRRSLSVRARKRFGQNFLQDSQVIRQIITAINPQPGERILEIGPGHGAMTRHLVNSGCDLTVVEIDRDLAAELRMLYPGLQVVEADILQCDLAELLGEGHYRVVGNLPYNISTPLLFRLFDHIQHIQDMYFMLQLEVVERLVAQHSTRQYGRLSIMSQYFCNSEKLFDVSPEAFIPKPKVTSAIVRLTPTPQQRPLGDTGLMQDMLIRAFSQRRKTVRNALKPFLNEQEMAQLGIDPAQRPETISASIYIDCANYLAQRRQTAAPS